MTTRIIQFSTLSLRDALDLAVLVEEEAKDRYTELTDQMEMHHNKEAARFFHFMIQNEAKHEHVLSERRKGLFGEEPRTVTREMIFDVEAPEYAEAHTFMTYRDALDVAARAEQKAYEFFEEALKHVEDPLVKKLFHELRDDEREHLRLVEAERKKAPDDPKLSNEDFSDDPAPQ